MGVSDFCRLGAAEPVGRAGVAASHLATGPPPLLAQPRLRVGTDQGAERLPETSRIRLAELEVSGASGFRLAGLRVDDDRHHLGTRSSGRQRGARLRALRA
eukprot:1571958-Alexandrium_andersonii.AAC.1